MSRNRHRFVLLVMVVAASSVFAQRGRRSRPVVSPEVHSDRTVTFHVRAPEARNVLLEASFLPRARLMRGGIEGLWSLTAGPLEPEIYEYNFVVDGLRIADPFNPFVKVWRRYLNELAPLLFRAER
jgi:enterochelin esterase family protein